MQIEYYCFTVPLGIGLSFLIPPYPHFGDNKPVTVSKTAPPVVTIEGERNSVEVEVPYTLAVSQKTLPIAVKGNGNVVKVRLVTKAGTSKPLAPNITTQTTEGEGSKYVVITITTPPGPIKPEAILTPAPPTP